MNRFGFRAVQNNVSTGDIVEYDVIDGGVSVSIKVIGKVSFDPITNRWAFSVDQRQFPNIQINGVDAEQIYNFVLGLKTPVDPVFLIPAFVQCNQFYNPLSASTVAIPFINNVTKGNILFVYAANNTATSVTDTQGNTYTKLASTNTAYTSLWWTVAMASGANTVTIHYGSAQTFGTGLVAEYTNPTSALDVTTTNTILASVFTQSFNYTANFTNETFVMFVNIFGDGSNYTSNSEAIYRFNTASSGSTIILLDHPLFTSGSYTESGFIQAGANSFGVSFIAVSIKSN